MPEGDKQFPIQLVIMVNRRGKRKGQAATYKKNVKKKWSTNVVRQGGLVWRGYRKLFLY